MTSLKHAHRGVVIGALFYFAAVTAYCLYSYFTTRAELLAEIDHRLMVGARATLLMSEEHVSRVNPLEVMDESAYTQLLERMNAYVEEANLAFVYIMAEKDGAIYFTASSYSQEESGGEQYHALRISGREPGASRMFRNTERSFSRITPTVRVSIDPLSFRRGTLKAKSTSPRRM